MIYSLFLFFYFDFEVSLKLYRDCFSQAPFDTQISIGIFEQNTNAIIDSTVTLIFDVYLVSLTMPGSQCAPPPDVCAEAGVYVDTLTLAPNTNGYYIAWQRCCRNPVKTVLTIVRPNPRGPPSANAPEYLK